MTISSEALAGTVVLKFSNGPVNALSAGDGLVSELLGAIRAAALDPACQAIVLTGEGRMFCGGADIADFDRDPALIGQLRALIETVEALEKPVVAAIHGVALGGGLELAMAAHYRVVAADARLGLPEITLGLVPGAGGTQRLPRLIGARGAWDIMSGGKPLSAERAKDLGLVDAMVEGDVVTAAVGFAQAGVPLRRVGRLAEPSDLEAVLEGVSVPHGLAQQGLLACLAASGLPLDEGLAVEAATFDALMRSDVSLALRHAFFAERKVSRIPGLPADVRARSIMDVGVVGGGLMGTGIAIALLNAGYRVVLVELREDACSRAATRIAQTIRRDVEKGRITPVQAEKRLAGLSTSGSLAALSSVDLAIEAVFEDMAVKSEVFRALDAILRPDAILASNTSTLDLDLLAGVVGDPSRVVGLHFFSPANIMRLLEIVRGEHTAPDVLATALDMARRMGKVGVISGVCDGFIGNRIFEEYLRQVWFMLEEGAMPRQIDTAMETWGMAMGPCRTMDLVGQDIGWAIRQRRTVEQPSRPYAHVIDLICEKGWFGQKTGRGIYRYSDGRTPEDDAEVEALLVEASAMAGLTRRFFTDEEIVSRCLLAMINEGAKIVGEGIAYRPLDVDMTYLHGYGFPRERGGPMFQGDLMGMPVLLERLRALEAGDHGWAFAPAPLIVELAARGDTFANLNG